MEVYASIGQKGLCLLSRGKEETPWELRSSCPAMFGASNYCPAPGTAAFCSPVEQNSSRFTWLCVTWSWEGLPGSRFGVQAFPQQGLCAPWSCRNVRNLQWAWLHPAPPHHLPCSSESSPKPTCHQLPKSEPAISSPKPSLPSAPLNPACHQLPKPNLPSAPQSQQHCRPYSGPVALQKVLLGSEEDPPPPCIHTCYKELW